MLCVMMQKAPKNHDIPCFTLPELTEEFQISEISIRVFEQAGLIRPSHKENGIPSYNEFQRARLRFVIYCDSLGYSAADIAKTIGSVSGDSNEIQQIEESLLSCDEKIDELKTRIEQNHNKNLEQIDILCDHTMLVRYIEEVEAIYAAAIQGPAPAYSPPLEVESKDTKEKESPPINILKGSELYKSARKRGTRKIVYAGVLMLLVTVVGYFHFSDSLTPTILPERHIIDRSAELSENRPTGENANPSVEKPADALTPPPFPADNSPSATEPEKLVHPQSVLPQILTPDSPPDSSEAPAKENPSEHLSAKAGGMNEAPSIPVSKPEKSASSAQANEASSFQATQNNQETSTIRTKPLQTEARRDADSLGESRLSPGSPHQEGVPEQNFIAPKKSTEYRSKPSGEATQAASSEHKDSQEADRDISDAPKNAASEGLTERPGQTHEMQKRSENLLASQTPSSKGLTRKEESDAPVNPNTLEAQEWLKKSNDSIARDDTLETIVTASLAIKLDPTLVQAYLNRAWAFSERGLYDKAIMDLSHTLQMDPDNAYAYSRRGLIFERKGDDLKAIADYEKACKLGLELGCENQQKYASHLRD